MITFFEHPNDLPAVQWREWIGYCGEALQPASKMLAKSDRNNSYEKSSKNETLAKTKSGAADSDVAIDNSDDTSAL